MRARPVNPTRVDADLAVGYAELGALCAGAPVVAVDGMWGADWDRIVAALPGYRVVRTTDYLRPPEELRAHFQPWLTDNPVFGRICDRPLSDYFRADALEAAARGDRLLVVGPGAAAVRPDADLRLYCDVPREEIIRRQRQEGLPNLGNLASGGSGDRYKAAYYVEWPLLEAHKRTLLRGGAVDYYVDCTDRERPVALPLAVLEQVVADVASRPFRCKPFFMPGVWGGQRLKEAAGLPPEWPNCAWDFEVVAPENAVTVDVGGVAVTLPFHILMWLQARRIVGEQVYRQFGEFFPVRINYLDTMQGGNLSLQVHPHHTYTRQQFGEPIGQDESYYVVERAPGSKVYLGLTESATRERLAEAVRRAQEEQVPFDIAEFANAWDAHVGDLFLIPAGTVHCSGAGNLVLEISSTPYWYTFKIYDYLRPDLDGRPRPINAGFAFDVIDFTRTTGWVERYLLPRPLLLREEQGGREYHLGSHAMTFYGVNRLHIDSEMGDDTAGGFLLLTVVSGEGAILWAADDQALAEIRYLETYVVPASLGRFRLSAIGGPCQVVKTYVRR